MGMEITKTDIAELEKISKMSHIEMARLRRFAPIGHPYFDINKPFSEIFNKRFQELGGMTTAISKEIGL